ncbi:hypothetical protein [Micromonospora sp. SH-82]
MFDDATAILDSALDGDGAAVARTIDTVVERSGLDGAYGMAWCLAATLLGEEVPVGGCSLEFPDIDEAEYDTRWVARFVSAYANHDQDTGEALFGAAVADGQLPECLQTLAGSTLATLRSRAG